jgi:hypothetical protein
MMEFSFAFWNLQNLFGVNSSEVATDLEFIPEKGLPQRFSVER